MNDGRVLYCAWISRDPEEDGEGGRPTSSFALASSFNSTTPFEYSVTSIAEVSYGLRIICFVMFVATAFWEGVATTCMSWCFE